MSTLDCLPGPSFQMHIMLKMHDYQNVNKYMIEFSKHATHTGWDDAALYGEFYWGLSECIKDQLLLLD